MNVLPLTVPPLRQRREDIPELLRHFVARISAEEGRSTIKGINRATIDMLSEFDWPGNIRQLENAVFRAVVLCEGDELTANEFPQIAAQMNYDLPVVAAPAIDATGAVESSTKPVPGNDPSAEYLLNLLTQDDEIISLEHAECEIIKIAIEKYNGSMSKIARKLGIGRSTLYRKLREYGLEEQESDESELLAS